MCTILDDFKDHVCFINAGSVLRCFLPWAHHTNILVKNCSIFASSKFSYVVEDKSFRTIRFVEYHRDRELP